MRYKNLILIGTSHIAKQSLKEVFNGEKIVMRLLSETAKAFTLEGLGLQGKALERIQDNLRNLGKF